jgi:hypothetical protein
MEEELTRLRSRVGVRIEVRVRRKTLQEMGN